MQSYGHNTKIMTAPHVLENISECLEWQHLYMKDTAQSKTYIQASISAYNDEDIDFVKSFLSEEMTAVFLKGEAVCIDFNYTLVDVLHAKIKDLVVNVVFVLSFEQMAMTCKVKLKTGATESDVVNFQSVQN